MSILIEAMSLVVPRLVLDVSYPGGTDAYIRDALAEDIQFRYAVADDRLSVMSFWDADAADPWVARLQSHGILLNGTDAELAFVDQRFGPTMPCNWLQWRRHDDGFTYAWLSDSEPGDMVAPEDWTAERSRRLERSDIRDEPGRMVQLADEDGIETWLDLQTARVCVGLAHREPADSPSTSVPDTVDAAAQAGEATPPLLPIVTRMLDARDLRYVALMDDCVELPIHTDHATYDCRIVVDDRLRTVTCYAVFGGRVPAARRLAVTEAIVRANFGLRLGCFELDLQDGELRFRVGIDVEGGTLTEAMAHTMLAAVVELSDRYVQAIMRVIHADADPATAIAEAEAR